MRFTVFTASFNRARTLPRLVESLCRQTFSDFEWVIVDDASTDGTAELIAGLRARGLPFPVTYLRQDSNGGKRRAINRGVGVAQGELLFIVDSDDLLPDEALQVVDAVERSIPRGFRARFAGVCGLKATLDGTELGTTFTGDTLDITTLQRGAHGISGDKAEVFDTAVLRDHPFPEFPGEVFLTEAVVWDRIAHEGLKLRFFNRVVYKAEYLEDGLSAKYRALLHANPAGQALHLRQTNAWTNPSRRLATGRALAFVDEHRDSLTLQRIAEHLGIPLPTLIAMLSLRQADRWGRRLRGEAVD